MLHNTIGVEQATNPSIRVKNQRKQTYSLTPPSHSQPLAPVSADVSMCLKGREVEQYLRIGMLLLLPRKTYKVKGDVLINAM